MTIRVLLVDDHAIVRDGLRFLLEAHGDFEVVGGAANGRDAVRAARELQPDVVIMDLAMPELNGTEATQQIHDACPATQVLVLSMHSTAEHIYRAFQAGAQGYLLKESAGPELLAAVRTVHAGRRYLSQKIAETMVDDYIRERHAASPLDSLSARERQILQSIAEGKSSAETARALSLSPKTVETYRSRMMKKLGLDDFAALVRFAIQHGLTPLE
ncbi:MAG TPA: response regulator transcription factor [Usitatibacter sp.]|jgi:DNA-binding NarL/FixJ family response regulator|nr:response regulator transcription factor [Usitatibacter sp.]